MTTKTYTRAFTRDELANMAYDYVRAGGRDASLGTAVAILDSAADSMLCRVEREMTADAEEIDVPNERLIEIGDAEIVQDAIHEALEGVIDEFGT